MLGVRKNGAVAEAFRRLAASPFAGPRQGRSYQPPRRAGPTLRIDDNWRGFAASSRYCHAKPAPTNSVVMPAQSTGSV